MASYKDNVYRSYCACCANYRVVHRYVNGIYYCRSCASKINKGLRKRHIDLHIRSPDRDAAIDEIVASLQTKTAEEKKETKNALEEKHRWRSRRTKRQR